jgi:hypothetical protein
MLSFAISQTSNDVMEIYYIVYDIVYDVVYDIVYDVVYDIVYDVVYDVVYYVVYDVVYDITLFIQPAARLLSGKMLLSGKKVMLAGEM